ncbi:MAG: DUF3047 domain-containing protein [Pseudomonadota bacterium]
MVWRQRLAVPCVLAGLAACAPFADMDLEEPSAESSRDGTLFNAANAIEDKWQHLQLVGATRYTMTPFAGEVAILAQGEHSASGLARRVSVDTTVCPEISWAWNVPQLQASADLTQRETEDVAASIFLIFGDPGLFSDPRPVPTLRYVWTTDHLSAGTIVDSPYLEGTVKSLVIRTGTPETAEWLVERRNLVDDFTAAYGAAPTDKIQAIILFTDNDQTKEPVMAYYGWARVHCLVEGVSVEEEIGWE